MGKTFLTQRVSKFLLSNLQGYLVVHVKLCQHVDFFATNTVNVCWKEFLREIYKNDDQLTECIAEICNSKKVLIFLDGFDEVRPEVRQPVVKLIENSVDEGIFLWVTTRPHDERHISSRVKPLCSLNILPLKEKVEEDILGWKTKKPAVEWQATLDNLRKNGAGDILENPLHLGMLAEIMASNMQSHDLISIYEKLLNLKIATAIDDKGLSKTKHSVQSMKELMQRMALKWFLNLPIQDEDVVLINKVGIVSIVDGKISFMHQTIAEFLVFQIIAE